jgi:hypothetical protein
MNKTVVQISALCWLFLLRLKMHVTNIKLFSIFTSILIHAGKHSTELNDSIQFI